MGPRGGRRIGTRCSGRRLRASDERVRSPLNASVVGQTANDHRPMYSRSMICLEVELNGAKVCRAGLGKRGLVHMNAAWHSLPRGWSPKKRRGRASYGDFGVSGVLYDPRPPGHENVSWTNGELAVGDELRLRLVDSESPDEPRRRERSEPIPERDQWDMICDRLDGCVRDLTRLKNGEAKQLAREIRALSKKARVVAAQPTVAADGPSRRR